MRSVRVPTAATDVQHGRNSALRPAARIRLVTGHRAASPWDDATRRPSHAGKRRAWRRELPAEQVHTVLRPVLTGPERQAAAERLLDLAA